MVSRASNISAYAQQAAEIVSSYAQHLSDEIVSTYARQAKKSIPRWLSMRLDVYVKCQNLKASGACAKIFSASYEIVSAYDQRAHAIILIITNKVLIWAKKFKTISSLCTFNIVY